MLGTSGWFHHKASLWKTLHQRADESFFPPKDDGLQLTTRGPPKRALTHLSNQPFCLYDAKVSTSASASPHSSSPNAWLPLIALTAMNMLNYLDRYIVAALLPAIQRDLQLSDQMGGLLGSAFVIVYFLVCPLFGWVGDRGKRPRWLALGVALWSLATAATGLAQTFFSLLLARASVGIGEAAYGAISPSLLADYYPQAKRGRVLSYFYLATPVGSAMGYLVGGFLGVRIGWRNAFYVVGLPGLLMAALALRLQDPPRGHIDGNVLEARRRGVWEVYGTLAKNRIYVMTVAGYTAYTFAMGGLAFWTPSYMIRVRHYSAESGMLLFGMITVLTGFCGTLGGGWLGDRLLSKTPYAYTWLNASSMLGAAGFSLAALLASSNGAFIALLVVAELFMFVSTGPVNAVILNAVPVPIRSTAMATSIFFIHLFGDAISPTLIGAISDGSGLTRGMLTIPAFYLLAGILWSQSRPKAMAALS